MFDEDTIAQLRGATLVAGSEEIGPIEEIYTYAAEDRPALASVRTDQATVLVPLPDAGLDDGSVTVGFDAETIASAPEPAGDTLTEEQFEAVYEHYGISDATMRDQSHP